MRSSAAPALLLTLLLSVPALAADGAAGEVMKGDWTFHSYVSSTIAGDPGEIHALRFGVSRYLTPTFSFGAEVVAGSYDAETFDGVVGGDGFVGGVDFVLRWTFHRSNRWQAHLVGGIGVVHFDTPFPSVATRTNFEDQVGVEFTFKMSERADFLAGVRYLHVSNADQFGAKRNPGYDAALPYLGLRWKL